MDNPPRPTTSALHAAETTTSVLVLLADNDVVLVAALETPRALCLNYSVIHRNHDGQNRTTWFCAYYMNFFFLK